MLRYIVGAGASASAMYASSNILVAHAAKPATTATGKPATLAEDAEFLPVYDEEVAAEAAPLPGTVLAAKTETNTKLSETESKIADKLELASVEAKGRVYRFSKLLQGYIGTAREKLNSQLATAEVKSQELTHAYRQTEQSAAQTVASLHAEHEPLLPQSIYILISALSGSIFARRRNFLVRFTAPLLFGSAAFAYFLPQTWCNLRHFAWQKEKEQFPTVARKHIELQNSVEHYAHESKVAYADTKKQAIGAVNTLRDQIRAWIGK